MVTWDNSLATELHHKTSFTLSLYFMLFKKVHLFEHDPHDRHGLHEGQAKSRNHGSGFVVSKSLSYSNAKELRDPRMGKDILAFKTSAAIEKRNCTTAVTNVNAETPFECRKSFSIPNQVRKSPSPFQPGREVQLSSPITNLTQSTIESKTAQQGQSKNGDVQPGHRTTLVTELSLLDNTSSSKPLPV